MSALLLTVFEPEEDESSRRINNGNNNDNDNSVRIQFENNSYYSSRVLGNQNVTFGSLKSREQALINETVRYNRGESKSIQLG